MSRCYPNTLHPTPIDTSSTRDDAVTKLETLISNTVPLLLENAASSSSDNTIYTGSSGIVLLLLRLHDHKFPLPATINLKCTIIRLIELHNLNPAPTSFNHFSPLGSVTGPYFVKILAQLSFGSEPDDLTVQIVRGATRAAIKIGGDEGNDEVLYGRAGLIWALMTLQQWEVDLGFDIDATLRELVARIIEAGQTGAKRYGVKEGLMWEWHGKAYLGAIHGAAGIITIFLQLPHPILEPYIPSLLSTLITLCNLIASNQGHLPSSLPIHTRSHPYVQVCHGSPGLLICLTTLRHLHPQTWSQNPLFASALQLAAEAVWQDAVAKKGLGICHGVAGNAWSLLVMMDDEKEDILWVGRALALLEIAGEMPPLGGNQRFRRPDREWSLFEGVAGTVAAWVEAWAALKGGKLEMSGFPGIGGVGARNIL